MRSDSISSPCFKFAGGSPAAGHFLLYGQKKVTKENAAPGSPALRAAASLQVCPCLRCSPSRAAAELGLAKNTRDLRQSSPTSPGMAPLLGGSHGGCPPSTLVCVLHCSLLQHGSRLRASRAIPLHQYSKAQTPCHPSPTPHSWFCRLRPRLASNQKCVVPSRAACRCHPEFRHS